MRSRGRGPPGRSWGARPWGCVTAGKLAGEVLEVVALAGGLSELGGDADGERVAADTGEVFAEQVSGSRWPCRWRRCGPLRCDGVPSSSAGDWELWLAVPVMASRSAMASPKAGSALTARRRAAVARRARRLAAPAGTTRPPAGLAVTTRPWSSTAGPVGGAGDHGGCGAWPGDGCITARLPGWPEAALRWC